MKLPSLPRSATLFKVAMLSAICWVAIELHRVASAVQEVPDPQNQLSEIGSSLSSIDDKLDAITGSIDDVASAVRLSR